MYIIIIIVVIVAVIVTIITWNHRDKTSPTPLRIGGSLSLKIDSTFYYTHDDSFDTRPLQKYWFSVNIFRLETFQASTDFHRQSTLRRRTFCALWIFDRRTVTDNPVGFHFHRFSAVSFNPGFTGLLRGGIRENWLFNYSEQKIFFFYYWILDETMESVRDPKRNTLTRPPRPASFGSPVGRLTRLRVIRRGATVRHLTIRHGFRGKLHGNNHVPLHDGLCYRTAGNWRFNGKIIDTMAVGAKRIGRKTHVSSLSFR